MARIPVAKLSRAVREMMDAGGRLTPSKFKLALRGLPGGRGAGRGYYRDLVRKLVRGETPSGTVDTEKAKGFLSELKRHLQRGEVQAGARPVTLSVRGRSMGKGTIDRLRREAAAPAADARAQPVRAQRLQTARHERAREAARLARSGRSTTGGSAAPVAPLTSVSRLPKERGGDERLVSTNELDDVENAPRTSVGPSGRLPLTGSGTDRRDPPPGGGGVPGAISSDADVPHPAPEDAGGDEVLPSDEPDDLAID